MNKLKCTHTKEQWITNVNIVLFVSSNFSCISHHSSYGVYSTSIMQTSMIYIENLTKFHLFLIIYFREVSKFYLNHNCFPSGTLWNISSFPFYTLVGEALMMTVSFTRVKDTTSSFQPSIPHLPSNPQYHIFLPLLYSCHDDSIFHTCVGPITSKVKVTIWIYSIVFAYQIGYHNRWIQC